MCSERFLDFPDKSILFSTQPLKITGMCIHRHQICWLFSIFILRGSSFPAGGYSGPLAVLLLLHYHCLLSIVVSKHLSCFCYLTIISLRVGSSSQFTSASPPSRIWPNTFTVWTQLLLAKSNLASISHLTISWFHCTTLGERENIMDPQNMWFLLFMKSKFRVFSISRVLLLRSCSVVEWTNCCHSEIRYFCNC